MRKRALAVPLFLAGLLLAGCSGETTEPKKVGEETSTQPQENKEEVKKDQVFKVGEQIQLGDNVLTVTKVEKSQGGEFDKPQQGNEFVIVGVKIENGGKENISYNPFDFQVKNSQGQITDTVFTTANQDTVLNAGELAPAGTVEGTLAFEAPAGDAGLQLIYKPNFWLDNETITVNLQ
ncbi:DUF4352 domain-containing protein [Bacillus sp. T33-2]|uniref:DUF4352 domain-containing protein n=1 Tax=Bacillus sp. T33-2 TaxID=2054168 RepID=UPI000C75EDC2|nr:DUF4352 domain-containing protein [Bacillus sp. T33-2]PLR99579.1 DUF4352 domain-containing protein [Bacillus sp. T33-2]